MNMAKKLVLTAICAAVTLLLWGRAFAADVGMRGDEVRDVSITPTTVTLRVNQERVLRAVVSPRSAVDKAVTWSSSDPGVVSVDASGRIKAVSPGKAWITASTQNGKTASCPVTVPDGKVGARRIEMATDTATVRVNQERTLFVEFFPYDVDDKSLVWTSSNPEIVIARDDGVIIGVSPGVAEITATSNNGETAVCKVTVPSVVLTGIEQQVQSKDIPSAQVNAGETLSAAALRLDVENAAKNTKSKQFTLTYSGKTRVSTAALRSAAFTAAYNSKEVVLRFRTLEQDGNIQGQLTVNPLYAGADDVEIRTGVYTQGDQPEKAKVQAAKYFKTEAAVVKLEQEGGFPMPVQVAAKADLAGLNMKAIKLYRYAGGAYKLYNNQECKVDSNGYVHFTASEGGIYVLVSD